MRKFIEALRTGKSYDYIANHGYELTKEELISIIKEYDYALESERSAKVTREMVAEWLEEELDTYDE